MSDSQDDTNEVAALCREALSKLGQSASFRSRVLLEMAIIELKLDASRGPSLANKDDPATSDNGE